MEKATTKRTESPSSERKHKLDTTKFAKVRFGICEYYSLIFTDPKLPDQKMGCEMTLEPCARGFCVGIYDADKNVIVKECTNFDRRVWQHPTTILISAWNLAEKLYEDFFLGVFSSEIKPISSTNTQLV